MNVYTYIYIIYRNDTPSAIVNPIEKSLEKSQ